MTVTLPSGITEETTNGLLAYRIETPAARGLVYVQGAHVAGWAPGGADDVLWLSEKTFLEPGKPIRGGVPICFPWFGPGRSGDQQPAHGFARVATWRLVDARVDDDVATLELELTGADVEKADDFPQDFLARYRVRMGRELELALAVTAGEQPLDFEEALHSYLSVGDIRQVRVVGLDGAGYLDKLDGERKVQHGDVEFTSETDRVYRCSGTTEVVDQAGGRRVLVTKQHSDDTVVWNPWVDKSRAMPDFGDDEWTGMCCVETANALGDAVSLAPGETHVMVAKLSVG